MIAPRLQINLSKIEQNARILVNRLGSRGISVTGVTKATQGCVPIARTMTKAGVQAIGESRLPSIQKLRDQLPQVPLWMLRAPMIDEATDIVASASISFATELDTIAGLSRAAGRNGTVHSVLLMVELGDLREGILPGDLTKFIREVMRFENIRIAGIGTNLACRSGIAPDTENMSELSTLAAMIERVLHVEIPIVSGGNSANLNWILSDADTGRINNLRLGESILLGREALHRQPLNGLSTDAFVLVAQVIESKSKPSIPWGERAQSTFANLTCTDCKPNGLPTPVNQFQSILALGQQDVHPSDLTPGAGVRILGASSDHLVINGGPKALAIGSEVSFDLNYSGLLRAMTSPFVSKQFV